jgi:hypothetical protein
MEWHFAKYRPDETTRDPIVGEFFSTDAVDTLPTYVRKRNR